MGDVSGVGVPSELYSSYCNMYSIPWGGSKRYSHSTKFVLSKSNQMSPQNPGVCTRIASHLFSALVTGEGSHRIFSTVRSPSMHCRRCQTCNGVVASCIYLLHVKKAVFSPTATLTLPPIFCASFSYDVNKLKTHNSSVNAAAAAGTV